MERKAGQNGLFTPSWGRLVGLVGFIEFSRIEHLDRASIKFCMIWASVEQSDHRACSMPPFV